MKVGVNTISWGIQISDIRRVLDVIAEIGFQGVEFAQRPNSLGVTDMYELKELLDERNLEFLTFNGGTLKERVDFCRDIHPAYMYVEHWSLDNIAYALDQGINVAFHPRVFAPNSKLNEIKNLLHQNKTLNIIIDVAHTQIMGEDPAVVLQEVSDRLVAVHLKDWCPDYGRSLYRFARGFTL